MDTDDLRIKYGKETNGVTTTYSKELDEDLWSDDYVLWLESQIISSHEVVADIRNKLGSVTALMSLVELRNDPKHKDYVSGRMDEQLLKAKGSIKYIKNL